MTKEFPPCPHPDDTKYLQVIDSCTVCETVQTICGSCGEILKTETEC
jgi:hypothetical protein